MYLSVEVPLGNLGKGVCLQGTVRDSGRRALEMGISLYAGLIGESGRGIICQGLMCRRRFWDKHLSP